MLYEAQALLQFCESDCKIGIFFTVYWVMWQQRTLLFLTCGMTAIHKLWYFKPF